jgi:hypothetical protein
MCKRSENLGERRLTPPAAAHRNRSTPERPGTSGSGAAAVVAQLVRVPACHAGGRGFEPRQPRQRFRCPSLPARCAVVAQLVRVPACHAGGRGFEPRQPRHSPPFLPSLARAAFEQPRPPSGTAPWRRCVRAKRPRALLSYSAPSSPRALRFSSLAAARTGRGRRAGLCGPGPLTACARQVFRPSGGGEKCLCMRMHAATC